MFESILDLTIKTLIAAACVSGASCLFAPLPAAAIDANSDHAQHMALLGAPIPKPEAAETSVEPAATVTKGAAKRARGVKASRAEASAQDGEGQAQVAAGGLVKQTSAVQTNCFAAPLRGVLADMRSHFGRPVIVTSGFRSHSHNRRAGGAKRSLHTHCMAADVQISGVSPAAIARWARSHPTVGGVGTYRRTRSVHVDVGVRTASWGGGSRG